MSDNILEMDDIVKEFSGVKVLDNVKLHVKKGSVHALVGENGAGKSTLMKCLFGIYKPESGNIRMEGKAVRITDTQSALNHGISMIHQELNPIPFRTVTDNIWVGRYEKKGFVIDESLMFNKTKKLLDDLDFKINPKSLANDLSVSELQAIEIAKAVSYDAKIIIMDEPTSSLTIAETEHLFRLIGDLKKSGRSIIYISHKLEEIFQIADEVTIMRDGQYVGTWPVKETAIDDIIQKMVGRSMEERFPPQEVLPQKEVMLKVDNLTSKNENSFKNISFELYRGEILGIGGLVGAQRTELIESIFGLRPVKSGEIYKLGEEIRIHNPNEAIKKGLALLTEERRVTGIVPMLSVSDNALLASYKKFSRKFLGIVDKKKSQSKADDVCRSMNVKMRNTQMAIKNLSGGNQQKVLIGRWLLMESNILILDEPTRGVDVGAKYEIYKIMRELVKDGNSIIMVSSEMPELLGMSDRILVMCNGRLTGVLDKEEASQVKIMKLATQF